MEYLTDTASQVCCIELKIKALNAQLKELKEQKSSLSETLEDVMKQKMLEHIDTDHGVIILKDTKQLESLNKEYIVNTLSETFKHKSFPSSTEKQIEFTTNAILNNRETQIQKKLKIKLKKT